MRLPLASYPSAKSVQGEAADPSDAFCASVYASGLRQVGTVYRYPTCYVPYLVGRRTRYTRVLSPAPPRRKRG